MNTKEGRGKEKKEESEEKRIREGARESEKESNYKKISVPESLKKSHSGFSSFSDGRGPTRYSSPTEYQPPG